MVSLEDMLNRRRDGKIIFWHVAKANHRLTAHLGLVIPSCPDCAGWWAFLAGSNSKRITITAPYSTYWGRVNLIVTCDGERCSVAFSHEQVFMGDVGGVAALLEPSLCGLQVLVPTEWHGLFPPGKPLCGIRVGREWRRAVAQKGNVDLCKTWTGNFRILAVRIIPTKNVPKLVFTTSGAQCLCRWTWTLADHTSCEAGSKIKWWSSMTPSNMRRPARHRSFAGLS